MIFSHRDVDILKLLCWCQFIQPRDLRGIAPEGDRKNLMGMAALEGQAEQVLFPRCRDKNLARVFVLTAEAISAVTGRKPVPYVPPRTQFTTSKGDVADAPLIQAHRKAGRSP